MMAQAVMFRVAHPRDENINENQTDASTDGKSTAHQLLLRISTYTIIGIDSDSGTLDR